MTPDTHTLHQTLVNYYALPADILVEEMEEVFLSQKAGFKVNFGNVAQRYAHMSHQSL